MAQKNIPAEVWGVFNAHRPIHIAPCNEEGIIADGHETSEFCGCHPETEECDGGYVVVHRMVH